METMTEQEKQTSDCDRQALETVKELISLYKREFGELWQQAFRETVSVEVGQRS